MSGRPRSRRAVGVGQHQVQDDQVWLHLTKEGARHRQSRRRGLGSRLASRALKDHNRVVLNDEDGCRGNPAVQANRVGKGCGEAVNAGAVRSAESEDPRWNALAVPYALKPLRRRDLRDAEAGRHTPPQRWNVNSVPTAVQLFCGVGVAVRTLQDARAVTPLSVRVGRNR